jgi:hypothetical protein
VLFVSESVALSKSRLAKIAPVAVLRVISPLSSVFEPELLLYVILPALAATNSLNWSEKIPV